VYAVRGEGASTVEEDALVVLMHGDDLRLSPSRHSLAGIDVVAFARGERAAIRDRVDGLARLLVRIPDGVMSAEHGRLVRVQARWMLDDPSSKNGATIAGRASRCAMLAPGELLELGHTTFALARLHRPADAPADAILDAADPLASLHPDLVAARDAIDRIATSDLPVTLVGESGTGKEVYAQAIHGRSGRGGPLIAVNCGALSASLLEAELFGHRKGAFSGATADRPGYVRAAHRGTLFLDEINELSPAGQVALLRVLQEREVVPVGDAVPIGVDVRVCVASQRTLLSEVESGRFRSDLYARLLGYELHLPPLRERPHDLGALIARLALRHAPARSVAISPSAARALFSYTWPRNIRELERCLARALVLAPAGPLELAHLPDAVASGASGRIPGALLAPAAEAAPGEELGDGLRERLAAKLVEHRGNVSAVARDFGKQREQIHRWMKRFGFDPEAFRR
jgi:transcriptional regulator with GAF, ATPase, and Fis domain